MGTLWLCTVCHQKSTRDSTVIRLHHPHTLLADATSQIWPDMKLRIEVCPICTRTLDEDTTVKPCSVNTTLITKHRMLQHVSVYISYCQTCGCNVGGMPYHHGFTAGMEQQTWVETSFLRDLTCMRYEAGLDLTDRGISKSIVHSHHEHCDGKFISRTES